MKILAWTWLTMWGMVVLAEPFMFGQPYIPILTAKSWIRTVFGGAIVIPMIGRILGWW